MFYVFPFQMIGSVSFVLSGVLTFHKLEILLKSNKYTDNDFVSMILEEKEIN